MNSIGRTLLALAVHATVLSPAPLYPQDAAHTQAANTQAAVLAAAVAAGASSPRFYLQPHAGVRLTIDGARVAYALLATENSLGLLKLETEPDLFALANGAPPAAAAEEAMLRISRAGFEPLSVKLSELGDTESLGKPAFIVLKKRGSGYSFQRAIATGKQPKSVRFIDERRVAVPLLDGPGIDIVDVYSGESQRIAPPPPYPAQRGFVETLALAGRDELWISQMTTGCIHVFSLSTLSYKATIRSSGVWGKVMAYNPVLDRVFFSNWVSQDLSIIDPGSYREERRVNFGAVPRGIAFSADGRFMYVAQYEVNGKSIGRLLKVDLSSMAIVARLGVEGSKRHIVTDAARGLLYVSDMARDIVEVYDMGEDRLLASIAVGAKPNTIELSPDGRLLYVSCRGPNNPDKGYLYKGYEFGRVYLIDAETLAVREWWEGGNQPTGLDVSPDGRLVVFSDFLDGRLRVYRRDPVARSGGTWRALSPFSPI